MHHLRCQNAITIPPLCLSGGGAARKASVSGCLELRPAQNFEGLLKSCCHPFPRKTTATERLHQCKIHPFEGASLGTCCRIRIPPLSGSPLTADLPTLLKAATKSARPGQTRPGTSYQTRCRFRVPLALQVPPVLSLCGSPHLAATSARPGRPPATPSAVWRGRRRPRTSS